MAEDWGWNVWEETREGAQAVNQNGRQPPREPSTVIVVARPSSSSNSYATMDTTPAAASPPLPTPQTPHFPGYFPETPSDSSTLSSAYDQREPPLDAAGRALPLPTGSVLLGAAAGLLLGGPLGAAAGASLAGLREMERTALSARVGNEAAAPEGQTAVEKEVGGLGGEGDQLLKGAAGAKVLDLEVPQIHTVDVDDAGARAVKDQEKVSLDSGSWGRGRGN